MKEFPDNNELIDQCSYPPILPMKGKRMKLIILHV